MESAYRLHQVGALYNRLNESRQAIESFQQALPIVREIGDRNGEANTLPNLGAAYKHLEQYQKSIEYAERALPIFQEVGDRNGEAKALGNSDYQLLADLLKQQSRRAEVQQVLDLLK